MSGTSDLKTIDLSKLKKEDITVTTKKFSEELSKDKKVQKFEHKGFSSTQLRKYYNELMAIKRRTEKESDVEKLKLDLGIFASKVEYGVIKAKSNEKESFKFYRDNVVTLADKVDSIEKFRNFMTIMEAVVAYFPKTK